MDTQQEKHARRTIAQRIVLTCGAALTIVSLLVACGGGSPPPTPTAAPAAIVQTPIAHISTVVAPVVETPIARAQTSVADIPTKVAAVLDTPATRVSGLVASVTANKPGIFPSQGACPADHPVKGRLEQFRLLYHLPGSAGYDQVKPEMCFATEADAQAFGYHSAG